MLRVLTILLSAVWLSGCFIFEEIRKGDALIEQHSSGWREKKKSMQVAEEETAKAEAETERQGARNTGPGVQDKLNEWWHETIEEDPVKTNRDDKLVSCTVGGKVQFIRESDCKVRRGRPKQLKAQNETTAPSKPKPGT